MTELRERLVFGFGTLSRRVSALARRSAARRPVPIVPARSVTSTALMAVIAIMTFLASLTLGGVLMVSDTARAWRDDIAREATIQIEPEPGLDMQAAIGELQLLALSTPGVTAAMPVGEDEAGAMLRPWLGGLDVAGLPMPRMIAVEIDPASPPDFDALREAVERAVPQATLDDHRMWMSRLVAMAQATVLAGIAILVLVVIAAVLTVVFATRGAMAGNRHIIEVLHFVGARHGFVAAQFQRHFLRLGLIGGAIGGLAALGIFALAGWYAAPDAVSAEGDQLRALFGTFRLGPWGYFAVALLAFAAALLTALTSRFTVRAQLSEMDILSPAGTA
ncbi:ABC transporter permease [Aureimonas sp. OT7]|uniref:cell division protein FtsX n=1 Tax=Aureimonas TaxID=414371 RepID=UPI001781547A|nr:MULTISPECIES: ABC transporter permease [Aureimonas]QOG07690.1 ABC transporter permease [Aureimonas sp. OT7]